jgi:hypothetical protein
MSPCRRRVFLDECLIGERLCEVVMSGGRYWLTDKAAPFATLLNVLDAHYNPEIRNDNFETLVRWAHEAGPDDVRMATFKSELTAVLQGRRDGLPPDAIDLAAEYDEWDTDEAFLAWLWRELYPDEAVPGAVA